MRTYLLLGLLLFSPLFNYAQKAYTASFEDGTKIDYVIYEDDPSLVADFMLGVDFLTMDFISGAVGLGAYSSYKFNDDIRLHGSLYRALFDMEEFGDVAFGVLEAGGTYIFMGSDIKKEEKLALKSQQSGYNTIKIHVVEHTAAMLQERGVSGGLYYYQKNSKNVGGGYIGGIFAGITRFKSMNLKYSSDENVKNRLRSFVNKFSIDLLLSPVIIAQNPDYKDSGSADKVRKMPIGARLVTEKQSSYNNINGKFRSLRLLFEVGFRPGFEEMFGDNFYLKFALGWGLTDKI